MRIDRPKMHADRYLCFLFHFSMEMKKNDPLDRWARSITGVSIYISKGPGWLRFVAIKIKSDYKTLYKLLYFWNNEVKKKFADEYYIFQNSITCFCMCVSLKIKLAAWNECHFNGCFCFSKVGLPRKWCLTKCQIWRLIKKITK